MLNMSISRNRFDRGESKFFNSECDIYIPIIRETIVVSLMNSLFQRNFVS